MNEENETKINETLEQGKKILLIEDDKTLSQVISGELEKVGFVMKQAFSGDDGLRMVRSEKPDLILK